MPRPPRVHFPGAVYHAMGRGNAGQKIFLQEDDPSCFLTSLRSLKQELPFQLHAYCLMSNHFHLLIRVMEIPLSVIMHRLLTKWARHLNLYRDCLGHAFQARYKACLCLDDTYFLQLLRYIHLNPVKAHLVRRPGDWRWSGHLEYLGRSENKLLDVAWPLSLFHQDPIVAVDCYEQFVLDGMEDPAEPEPKGEGHKIPHPNPPKILDRPKLAELAASAAKVAGIDLPDLQSRMRTRDISGARRLFARQAISSGYRISAIAKYLGVSPAAISKSIRAAEKEAEKS